MAEKKPQPVPLESIRVQSWNTCIAPRAEALLSYLRHEVYQKGIVEYLRTMESLGEKQLLTGCKTRDDDQFMRGYLTSIKEVLSWPEQIEQTVEAKKNPPPKPSEYTA